MSKYVEFPLEGGGTILIESAEEKRAGGSGFVNAGRGDNADMIEKAQATLEASFESVRRASDTIIQKLSGLSQKPDEVEVIFGLKVSGELGNVVVAKAGGEANYTITLRWRSEKPKDEKEEKGE